jgi:hypothetical protein
MDWTRTKLVFGCFLALSVACGDDDGDDDDDVSGDGGADAGARDAGGDAGSIGNMDGGRDGGIDAGGDGGNLDASMPGPDSGRSDGGASPLTSFFVTSDRNPTGNLGGLAGADARCQRLAAAAGLGSKSWRADLSVERDVMRDGGPTEARSRIGSGPWYNANGQLVASDLASLHARIGSADLFVDERGQRINGQWAGSPTPNEHDILTGTAPDGGVAAGETCADWTSESDAGAKRVGHSDGLGPMMNGAPPYNSWFSSHTSPGCHTTLPQGGAGKIYCFAATP